jgi:endonuclease/exonuclease/phosphatase family metal-dependent hydrolase
MRGRSSFLGWLSGVSALCLLAELALAAPGPMPPALSAQQGKLDLVTYNVAGLPEGISRSHPLRYLPLIGVLLNQYDLALVQEDFAYPLELRRELGFAHSSPAFVRGKRLDFGDGLSEFSRLPFSGFEREAWATCNGYFDAYFDCLTPKGFTFARHELGPGVFVDVYNVHLDAGNAGGDLRARDAQLLQLSQAILRRSEQHAVIVAGDTNIRSGRRELLHAFEQRNGLTDACDALHCAEPRRVDRVFFRSTPTLTLNPVTWQTDPRFIDAQGSALSDHLAVAVQFEWQAAPAEPAVSAHGP